MLVNSVFNRFKRWKKILIPLMVAILTIPVFAAGSVGVMTATHNTPIVYAAKSKGGSKGGSKSGQSGKGGKSSGKKGSKKSSGSGSSSSGDSGASTDSMTSIVQTIAKHEQNEYTENPSNEGLITKTKNFFTRVWDGAKNGQLPSKANSTLGVTPGSIPGNQWSAMAGGNGLLHMFTKNSYSTGYSTLTSRKTTMNQGKAAEYGLVLYDMGLDHSSESSIALDMFDRVGRLIGGFFLYVGVAIDTLDYFLFRIIMKVFNFVNPARLIAYPKQMIQSHTALAPLTSWLGTLIEDCKTLGIIAAFFSLIFTFALDFMSRKRPNALVHSTLKWCKKLFFITAVPLIVYGCFQFAEDSMGTMFAQDQDSASAYAIDSGMINFKNWADHSRLALPSRYSGVLPFGQNANVPPTTHQIALAINDQGAGLKTAHDVNDSATGTGNEKLSKNGTNRDASALDSSNSTNTQKTRYGLNSELMDMISSWMHDSPYTSADWESYVGAHMPSGYYKKGNFKSFITKKQEPAKDSGSANVPYPFANNGTLDVKNDKFTTQPPSNSFGPIPSDNYGGISTIGMFNYLRSIFQDHGYEWISATDLTNSVSSPVHKDVGMTGTGAGFLCNFIMIITMMYIIGLFGLGIIYLDIKMAIASMPNLLFKGMATEVGFVGSFKSSQTWGSGIKFLVTALQLIAWWVLTSILYVVGRQAMIAVSQVPDQWFGPSAFNNNMYGGGSGFILKTLEGLGMSSSEAGAFHSAMYYFSLLGLSFLLWVMLRAFMRNFTLIRKGLEQLCANLFRQLFSNQMNQPDMNNNSRVNGGATYSNNQNNSNMMMNSHSLLHAISGNHMNNNVLGGSHGGVTPATAGAGAPGIGLGKSPTGLLPSGDTRGNQIKQDGANNSSRFGGNKMNNNSNSPQNYSGFSDPSGRGIPGAAEEQHGANNGANGVAGKSGHSPFSRGQNAVNPGASGNRLSGSKSDNPGADMLKNHPGLSNGSFPQGSGKGAGQGANNISSKLGAGSGPAGALKGAANGLTNGASGKNGASGILHTVNAARNAGAAGAGVLSHAGLGAGSQRGARSGLGRLANGRGNNRAGAILGKNARLGGANANQAAGNGIMPNGFNGAAAKMTAPNGATMAGAAGTGLNGIGANGINGASSGPAAGIGTPADRLGDTADNILNGGSPTATTNSIAPNSALHQNSHGGNYGQGGTRINNALHAARSNALHRGLNNANSIRNNQSMDNSRRSQNHRMGLFGSPKNNSRRRKIMRHVHMPRNVREANNMVRSAMGAKHFANQAMNGIRNQPNIAPAQIQAVAKQNALASRQLQGAQLGASMLHEAQPLGSHLINPNFGGSKPTNGQARMAYKNIFHAQNALAHVSHTHQSPQALRLAGNNLTNATQYAHHLGLNPSTYRSRPQVAKTLRSMNTNLTKAVSGQAPQHNVPKHIVNIHNEVNQSMHNSRSLRRNSVINSAIENHNVFRRK